MMGPGRFVGIKWILFITGLLAIGTVAGQGGRNLSYKQLSVNQGLSHSDVTSMVQDGSGHLWLGTHNGLNKYDGQKVTVFKNDPEDSTSLPDNRIAVLFADKSGNIWIGTERNGLCVYNTRLQTFTNITRHANLSDHLWITDIRQDPKGLVWATSKKGNVIGVGKDQQGDFRILSNISFPASQGTVTVNALLIADPNKIYLSTEKGVYTCYPSGKLIEKSSFINNDEAVLKLLRDYTGTIWVAKRSGLYKIEGLEDGMLSQPVITRVQLEENMDKIESIFQDKSGAIWIGTLKDGVFRLKPQPSAGKGASWKIEHPLTNLNGYDFTGSFFNIKCFFEDKYGLIWIGTAGGGAIYSNFKNKLFYTISPRRFNGGELINDTYISSVYADKETLWMGTRKGLCILNTASGTSEVFLKDKTVTSIFKDHNGVVWIGLAGRKDGLWRFDKSTGLTRFGNDRSLRLSGQSITSITEDDDGKLWVSTINGGINIISAGREHLLYLQAGKHRGLLSNNVTHVYNDPRDPVMWVSYRDKGLAKITEKDGLFSISNYIHQPGNRQSLSSNFVWTVKRIKDGTLWIATLGGGLNKMIETARGPVFQSFTAANGLKDNDIESMEEDVYGNLWLAGYGLTNFNTKTGKGIFYDYTDGLQSNSFKVGSSFRDSFGRLYFGGINGLNYFDPTIENGSVSPDIVLTAFKLFNKEVLVGEEKNTTVILPGAINFLDTITLDHAQNDFSIEFVGLQFASAPKVKYRYRLSNYHEDWVETGFPSASFAKLAPGKYQFTVYAVAGNNSVSNQKQLMIIIKAPWWFTWWAFVGYLFAATAIVWIAYSAIRKESRLKRELAIAEKEKELNQGKLEFFTNISHELRTPMTLIYGPLTEFLEKGVGADYRQKLWQMYRNAKRILTLTNQLLDFRKMETGHMRIRAAEVDIAGVINEIFLVFKNKAEVEQIEYTLVMDQPIYAYCDRQKMEIVFTNLLSNAFKYTPRGGSIRVEITVVGDGTKDTRFWNSIDGVKRPLDNYLKVMITDNGEGIPAAEVSKIFNSYYQASQAKSLETTGTGLGLAITKGIIDMHQGIIGVSSELNKGTVFMIALPLGKAHLNAEDISLHEVNPDDIMGYEVVDIDLDNESLPASAFVTDNRSDTPPLTDGENPWLLPDDHHPSLSTVEINSEGAMTPVFKLLIVEDNLELAKYLQKTLSVFYKIVMAKDGKEGLWKVRQYLPDLILSDVMMPEMDGIEMCRLIKSDPEINYIPVILLTARTASVYEIEGIETGADDYVTKPFNFRLLKAKLHNQLTQRQNVRQYFKNLIALQPSEAPVNMVDEQFLDKLIKLVEASLTDDDFSVKRLSIGMAMSQSTLYKRIKDLTGNSVVDFVKSVRIRRAAQLLSQQHMKINEVALEVGITDQKYFREQFRKYFGQTPSEYIKNAKTNDSPPGTE